MKNIKQCIKFGDVVKNANLTERDPEGTGIERIVGLEHLDPRNLHIKRWNSPGDGTSFSRKFVPGQTLFGKRRAYQRKVAYAEFEGICSGDILTFESKDSKVLLPELLPFICQSDAFFDYALGTSAGSLSPRTSWKALKDFEFLLPPIEEQKRMAEILWAADEVITNLSSSLDELINLHDALMAGLFHDRAKALVWVPAADICDKISVGIVIKPATYYVETGGVPTLRSLNVFPGSFNLDELVYLSDEGNVKNKKSILREGDVVIVRTGRPGDACVVNKDMDGFNAIDLIITRPNDKLLPEYLTAFINSSLAKRQFRKGIAGTAQTHFNVGEFKKLKIPMLPLEDQALLISKLKSISGHAQVVTEHLKVVSELGPSYLSSYNINGLANV